MANPDFFIIGAPKCGTTSLAAWLAGHPDIWMSDPKEPNFYAEDVASSRFVKSREHYDKLFVNAPSGALCGEASTTYLRSPNAVPKILAENPWAKLIVCLRDPLEMAPSVHGQLVKSRREPITDFATAWAAQGARRGAPEPRRWDHNPADLIYGDMCRLGAQVDVLLTQAPRAQVHFVFAESLKTASAETYRKVLTFLGIEDDGRIAFENLNKRVQPRSLLAARLIHMAGTLRHRLGLRRGLGIGRMLNRVNAAPPQSAPAPASLRAEMAAYFREDVTLLSRLTGQNLDHWLATQPTENGGRDG